VLAGRKDKLDRNKEGIAFLIFWSLFGVLLLFFIVSLLFALRYVSWAFMSLPLWIRYIGLGLAVTISPLLLWMFRSLGSNITDTVDTRAEHTPVTGGIYRFVRHPLYILASPFYGALGLITDNWVFFALGGFSFLVIGIIRTGREEQELEERFGDEFRAYRARTGKYLPRLRGRQGGKRPS
jgi:protein-S-isoprenylcysteine O-methyltransferase Ste14